MPISVSNEFISDTSSSVHDSPPSSKQRRVSQACDICRKKKIRCDGGRPRCLSCCSYGTQCTYSGEVKSKARGKGQVYIETLENRMARMEGFIKTLVPGYSDGKVNSETTGTRGNSVSSNSDIDPAEQVNGLAEDLGSLLVDNAIAGDTQYLGPSSGFAILCQSSYGNQLNIAPFDGGLDPGTTTLSRDLVRRYIDAYFENETIPILHRPSFEAIEKRAYTSDPPREKCWWACRNMVIAIGSHYVELQDPNIPLKETVSWAHFEKAYARLADLLQGSNLSSLQALLLIIGYLQTTLKASRWLLMGSAVQLAQAMGLHRRTQRPMDPVTKEQRNRLFWACHVMANNISMLVGRPSPIQDYDCDVDLPLDVDDDQITPQGIIPSNARRPFNFFLNDIKLSKIVSKVYCRLYSARALANHTWDSLADAIGELDSELIQWRDAIPFEYRPEQEIAWADTPAYRRVMLTHMSYYNCMYTIHRPIFSLALRSGSSFAPDKPVRELRNARVYGSAAVCVGAARSGLRLVLDVGERLPGLVSTRNWLLIYYPFSSIIALFASISGNPTQPSAKKDIELITAGRHFFEKLSNSFEVAPKLIDLTEGFERTASQIVVVQDSRKRNRSEYDASPEQPMHDITQQMYSAEPDPACDWLVNDVLYSSQGMMSGEEFQSQLMQSSDMWMAPASLDWGDWLEYIGRMPVQGQM